MDLIHGKTQQIIVEQVPPRKPKIFKIWGKKMVINVPPDKITSVMITCIGHVKSLFGSLRRSKYTCSRQGNKFIGIAINKVTVIAIKDINNGISSGL